MSSYFHFHLLFLEVYHSYWSINIVILYSVSHNFCNCSPCISDSLNCWLGVLWAIQVGLRLTIRKFQGRYLLSRSKNKTWSYGHNLMLCGGVFPSLLSEGITLCRSWSHASFLLSDISLYILRPQTLSLVHDPGDLLKPRFCPHW